MVSESIEFVANFFDDTFNVVSQKNDRRISVLKKYCKTLQNLRTKRVGDGSVTVSLQILDSLKYTDPSLNTFLQRIENGEIILHNEDGSSAGDIIITGFGSAESKNGMGWKGTIAEFVAKMSDHKVDSMLNRADSNRFFLRSFPKDILDSERVEFYIFGVVANSDKLGYDTAIVSVVGVPSERLEEIHEANVLKMFGY